MMKKNLLYMLMGSAALFLLSSCADPGYYSYGGGYSSGYYPGSSLSVLPHGYTRVYVGSVPYYYHSNRWYRYSKGRYVSCARPSGYRGSLGSSRHYSSYKSPYYYNKYSSNYKRSSNHWSDYKGRSSHYSGNRYSSGSHDKHKYHNRSSRDSDSRHRSHSSSPRMNSDRSRGDYNRNNSHSVVGSGSRGSSVDRSRNTSSHSSQPDSRSSQPKTWVNSKGKVMRGR